MNNMNYKQTVAHLMANSHDLYVMPGDGIMDEMLALRDSVLPYLDVKNPPLLHLRALATIFRACSKYAAQYSNCEQYQLWKDMEQMYIEKNADYGDSWSDNLNRKGIVCMDIRAYEKLNRVITITLHGTRIKTEKTSDTLQDICNYCVMTAMWILNKSNINPNNNEQE